MSTEATKAIEAILMVAQEPVEPHLLAQLLEVAPARVAELCAELQAAYEADERGFVLAKVAGGYRFQSHADMAPYVERFVLEGQTARLSSAALETLAIVAYKQPISRAQVAAIRGVNVDGVMRTLQQRGYVHEVGRDPGPGQATMFGTTNEFLERLGLDSTKDLPPIAALFPSADVMEALERGLRAEPLDPLAPTGAPDPADRSGETNVHVDVEAGLETDVDVDAPSDVTSGDEVGSAPAEGFDSSSTIENDEVGETTGEPQPPAWFTELEHRATRGSEEPSESVGIPQPRDAPESEQSDADTTGTHSEPDHEGA